MRGSFMLRICALTLLFTLLPLSGCSTWQKLDNTERGAIIGGGTGAAVGSAVGDGAGATVVGGALGAVGGGLIGHEMDEDERRRHRRRY